MALEILESRPVYRHENHTVAAWKLINPRNMPCFSRRQTWKLTVSLSASDNHSPSCKGRQIGNRRPVLLCIIVIRGRPRTYAWSIVLHSASWRISEPSGTYGYFEDWFSLREVGWLKLSARLGKASETFSMCVGTRCRNEKGDASAMITPID